MTSKPKNDQMTTNLIYQQELVAKIFDVTISNDSASNESEEQQDIATQSALQVYSNNFFENGIRALSITFPTVMGFIGEESFRVLSKHFLRHESKVSFDWAEYGCSLPEFIDKQEALDSFPFLSEVAKLDWEIHQVQRCKDGQFEGASFASLESGDTSALVFVPAPGLQVHRFLFPVIELYQLIHEPNLQSELGAQARQELLKYVKAAVTKALNSDSGDAIKNDELRSLVLWRPEYKAQFEYVSEAEAEAIRKIKTQSSVDAIIEHIGSHNIDLLTWLTKAISNKFIFAVA